MAARAAVGSHGAAMSEAELLAAVRQLARLSGWMTYHTHDSRRSEAGWPDLALANVRQGRIIFAELKTATGRTTPQQDAWLAALAAAGCETAVWRPADLPEIACILRNRSTTGVRAQGRQPRSTRPHTNERTGHDHERR